jgi:hypothetical protein
MKDGFTPTETLRLAPGNGRNGSWSCKNGAAGYQVVVIIGMGDFRRE